jgi:N-methylhydantoinase A
MYRICSLTSGQDPRDFVLFAMGGAGAVHAAGYAEGADVSRVATFPFSSVFGAFSTLALDILQTYERTYKLTLFHGSSQRYLTDELASFNATVAEMAAFARRDMSEEGFDLDTTGLVVDVSMCYGQQRKILPIRLDGFRIDGADGVRRVCDRFNKAYAAQFGEGATYPQAGIEANEIRLSAVGPVAKFAPSAKGNAGVTVVSALRGSRRAFWGPGFGNVDTPVYERDALPVEATIDGPVLCDAEDTVIVVPPGWSYHTDRFGFGWIERTARGAA